MSAKLQGQLHTSGLPFVKKVKNFLMEFPQIILAWTFKDKFIVGQKLIQFLMEQDRCPFIVFSFRHDGFHFHKEFHDIWNIEIDW
jgi:hypothetical protein